MVGINGGTGFAGLTCRASQGQGPMVSTLDSRSGCGSILGPRPAVVNRISYIVPLT